MSGFFAIRGSRMGDDAMRSSARLDEAECHPVE
jgi:hypothetical protein